MRASRCLKSAVLVLILAGCGCRKGPPRSIQPEIDPSGTSGAQAIAADPLLPRLDVAGYLPQDTALLFAWDSISDWARRLGRDQILATFPEAYAAVSQGLGRELGFDLLDPAAWTANGLDPTAPFGMAIVELREGTSVFFARVADVDKVRQAIKRQLPQATNQPTKDGDVYVRAGRILKAVIVRGGWMLAITTRKDLTFVTEIAVRRGAFKPAPVAGGAFAANLVWRGLKADPMFLRFAGGTTTFGVDAGTDRATLHGRHATGELAQIRQFLQPGGMSTVLRRALWEVPVLWGAARIEPQALGKLGVRSFSRFKKMASAMGIDLEADVLGALDGRVEAAITSDWGWELLPEDRKKLAGHLGLHVVVGLASPDRARFVVDTLSATLRSQVIRGDGAGALIIEVPVLGSLFARVSGDRFVVTTDQKLFERLDSSDRGFVARVKPPLQGLIAADGTLMGMMDFRPALWALALGKREVYDDGNVHNDDKAGPQSPRAKLVAEIRRRGQAVEKREQESVRALVKALGSVAGRAEIDPKSGVLSATVEGVAAVSIAELAMELAGALAKDRESRVERSAIWELRRQLWKKPGTSPKH